MILLLPEEVLRTKLEAAKLAEGSDAAGLVRHVALIHDLQGRWAQGWWSPLTRLEKSGSADRQPSALLPPWPQEGRAAGGGG